MAYISSALFRHSGHLARVLFLTTLLAAVSSGQAQEHILPDEYYPAYPGTWWKYKIKTHYLTGDSTVESNTTVRVSEQYRLVTVSDPGGCPEQKEVYFVPVVNPPDLACSNENQNKAIFGTKMRLPGLGGCGLLVDFIRKAESESWNFPIGTRGRCDAALYVCPVRTVVSMDTSLVVSGVLFDSLLHIRQTDTLSDTESDEFYKRGIGMVSSMNRDESKKIETGWDLVEYQVSADRKLDQIVEIQSVSGAGSMPMSVWGNASAFNANCHPSDPSNTLTLSDTLDTIQITAKATSGLPVKVSIPGGRPLDVLGDKIALEKGFYGFRVQVDQEGNDQYRAAPSFQGTVCVHPFPSQPKVARDPQIGILSASGFPDSSIIWIRSDNNSLFNDTVGRGSTHLPGQAGYYAAIPESTLTDSICGSFSYQRSGSVHVDSIPSNIIASSGAAPAFSLRIFGTMVPIQVAPGEAGALRLEIWDIRGIIVPGIRLARKGNFLEARAVHASRPGFYFYRLTAGSIRNRGRVFHGGLPGRD